MTEHEIVLALKREMYQQNIPQTKLAAVCGVHPNTILRLNRQDNMCLNTLVGLAEALDMEVLIRKKKS